MMCSVIVVVWHTSSVVYYLVGNVGHVVSAKFFENADMTTSRRHVGDMSARHVADMVVVVTIFGARDRKKLELAFKVKLS